MTVDALGELTVALDSGATLDVALEAYQTILAVPPKRMLWSQQVEITRTLETVIARVGAATVSLPEIRSRISSSFQVKDKRAAQLIGRHHSFWVRDAHGRIAADASAKARAILQQGILEGVDRRELARRLRSMTVKALRQEWYYETAAANLVGRARSYSQGRVYEEAGIEAFRIQAVLDDRTTHTCEFLHNKILPVTRSMDRIRATLASPNPETVLTTQPFTTEDNEGIYIEIPGQPARQLAEVSVPSSGASPYGPSGVYHSRLSPSDLVDAGIGFPPYHHRCRTTTVPVIL